MSGCGAAVVAMRQWGMCDTLVDQVTGFLCRDEREYVRRVAYLLENPEIAQLMGVAGHQFVRNFFSYDCVCEQWARVFAEVSTSALPSDAVPAIRGRYPFRMLRAMNGKWHCTKLHSLISFFDRIRGAFLKRY